MRGTETRGLILLGICYVAGLGAWRQPPIDERQPETPPTETKVRLAVLIVVDQLRGDLLTRWEKLFGDRGFRRLARDGAWFQNCRYPYASTFTAAGHASVVTGCSPRTHGIIGNDWYDIVNGTPVSAVRTDRHRNVPFYPVRGKKVVSGSPHLLLSPTVADSLKEATRNRGKVVALSVKDRSAVLPGGQTPDACYWADAALGLVVTSSGYRGREHAWVEEFNRERLADRWLGKEWVKLRDDLIYDLHTGYPDDMVGEDDGYGQGTMFPHEFPERLGEKYYEAVANSPYGNRVLLELAKKAIVAEKLGQDDIPDLLSISFSSNDLVGHTWGPDSHEVLDVTLRTDRDLMDLLLFLDEKVGKGNYAVVLTADHGVSPTPEVARRQGKTGQRVNAKELEKAADAFLQSRYGVTKFPTVEKLVPHDFYLSRSWLRANGLKQEDVEKELAAWVREQPMVQAAYTKSELLQVGAGDDALKKMVRLSFHPNRSGDVVMVLKPYHFLWDPLQLGTSHGTPHDYDRHVPLMVLGPHVQPGVQQQAVTPLAAATILAHFLGIPTPRDAEVGLPADLFQK